MTSVFISYAHADENLKNRLLVHLAALRREGLIGIWHDRMLKPGEHLDTAIEAELAAADLVILLISPDFINSNYCTEKEMQRAFVRAKGGQCKVAAVILKPCRWHNIPTDGGGRLGDFLAIPCDAKPVTQWSHRDAAWDSVVADIRDLITDGSAAGTVEQPQQAAGGFWASLRQSNFNAEIREKNEEIAQLQHEGANAITGGDSFAWVAFQIFGADGTAVNAYSMPDDLLLVPNFIHQGKYPLYDVSVRFADVAPDRPLDVTSAMRSYSVGNLAPGLAATAGIRLAHHGKDFAFNIFFAARNGTWTQFLRMPWVGDGWGSATKVLRGTQEIYREVSNNFPRQQDGSIDWGDPSAQGASEK
jgi:TIR domain